MGVLRRLARIVLMAVLVGAAVLLLAFVVLQTPWARHHLRELAERQAEAAIDADVSIGALEGNLVTGAELRNVRVRHEARPVASVPEIHVDYSIPDLLTGDVDVSSVRLQEPVIHLRRTEKGRLNIAALAGGAGDDARVRRTATGDGRVPPTTQSTGGFGPLPPVEGLAGEPMDAPAGSRRGWSIGDIIVRDGTLTIGDEVVANDAVNAPERLVNLHANLGIRSRPEEGIVLTIDTLSFRALSPDLAVRSAEGRLVIAAGQLRFDELSVHTAAGTVALDGAIRERLTTAIYDLRLGTTDLELPTLAPFVPALDGFELSPTIEGSVEGPLRELRTRFEATTRAGAMSGDVTLDATAPSRAVRGTIRTRDLNLGAFALDEQTDITLSADVDLRVPKGRLSELSGTYEVTATEFRYGQYDAENVEASGRIQGRTIRVDATAGMYGGRVQTEGTITLPSGGEPVQYDLTGKLRGVKPSKLPRSVRPPRIGAATRQNRRNDPAHARNGLGIDLDFRLRGRGGEIAAEARLLNLSLAGAEFSDGTVINVSRRGGRLRYSAEGTVRNLDLRRLGRELGMEELTTERFASDINAHFDLTGAGTEMEALTLRGTATLFDSELARGFVPELILRPNLRGGSGTIAVEGRFERMDVGAFTHKADLESRLHGTVDATLALESLTDPDLALGGIDASGRLTLAQSVLAGVPVDTASVEATLSDATARVHELAVAGPDVAIEASGTLALSETGTSDFRYLIDTPALQRFEDLGLPARGDVLLKGRLTGNLARLMVTGTMSGTHVGYAGVSALSAHSEYAIVLPQLSLARATVAAVSELSGLEIAGRSFAAMKARTEYERGTLDLATTIEEAGRTLAATGRLEWHPDHREVHLRRFDFRVPDATWALATIEGAAIEYSGDALRVTDLVLASDTGGRIAVGGAIGSPRSLLTVSIDDFQLDHVDDLILVEEGLSGIVDADAEIRGTAGDFTADVKVQITSGEYRGFQFQRVDGTVRYASQLVRLDVRVQQRDGVALTAAGVVPLSETAGEPLRVAVRSTPMDLSIVQTLTDELRDASGTVQLNVEVLGTVAEPALEGSLHVRNGAFTVTVAQSHYTGFDTDLTFEGGRVHVREFHLVDDEGNRLRVGGQLAVAGASRPDVNIRIWSENFEVADNRLAELNLDTDLAIRGELLRPRIEGTIAVRESHIRVDRILRLAEGAYEVEPEEPERPADEPRFSPSVAIRMTMPDTLGIRGTDLRAPGGAPIGLGDVNITIGGDLQIRQQRGEELVLAGELQTVRGTYEFQGRRFDIQRDGRVVFMGTPELNPRLDVRAQREISGVIATVHIEGMLDAPELALSSQPPMEDAEILSLIVFNQPLSLLGTGQQISLAARATAIASGFVASQLTDSVSEALELDLFEIQTVTAGGGLAPVLTLGEQFGQLFVKLRQRFGPEAVSEAVVEYRIAEWLRLETSYAQAEAAARQLLQRVEAGGIDLLFFFSY